MADSESAPPSFRITTLDRSFDALGLVLDALSREMPFSQYPAHKLVEAVRSQLSKGYQVAALGQDNELLGYAGWIPTLRASAELWVADRGALKVVSDQSFDAVALTIVVSRNRAVTSALMRTARLRYPGLQVFFKRDYDLSLRSPKRQTVKNVVSQ